MSYLVSIKPEQIQKMTPYLRKQFINHWAVVEVEDAKVKWLKEQVEAIEPDFILQLGHTFWHDLGVLADEHVLIGTIGKYCLCKEMQYTYNVTLHRWEEQSLHEQKAIWVHAYSQTEQIYASDWIEVVTQFYSLAARLNRPLIIIQNTKSVLPYFSEHSLAQEVVEAHLGYQPSLIIEQNWNPNQSIRALNAIDFKPEKIINTGASTYKLQKELGVWLGKGREERGKGYQVEMGDHLYSDVFYHQIPSEQKLYVPISGGITKWNNLKLNTIQIAQQSFALYEKKQKLEQHQKALKASIFSYLDQPIMTRVPLMRTPIEEQKMENKVKTQSFDQGEHVYIGIITDEGIDYRHSCLRTSEALTRIAMYWLQEEGDKGKYYTSKDLNRGLENLEAIPQLSWVSPDNDSTAALIWAGGKEAHYTGIAPKAQFLVAQIQRAPIAIQSIYGGRVSERAVLLPDIVIAAGKLIEKARMDHKPLVLLVPYQGNLSAHDGTGFYERILDELGRKPGCSVIVPVGEEGNKKHHQRLDQFQCRNTEIYFEAVENTNYVVGELYFRHIPRKFITHKIECYSLLHEEQVVALDEAGEYAIEDGILYSTGLIERDGNGMQMIRFAIRDMQKGKWCIRGLPPCTYQDAKVDFYLADDALNANVRCQNATSLGTLGMNAAIEGVLSVGAYDEKNGVGWVNSGKGEEGEGVRPFCVMNGQENYISTTNKRYRIEGSMVAASLTAGIIALIYESQVQQGQQPFSNTLRIKQILLSALKTELDRVYPSAMQGYGILSLESVAQFISYLN